MFLRIMEAKVQKQVIDYFSHFEEFYNAVNSSLKDCQKCLISINKLSNRCSNIKLANIRGTPLEEFDDLQSKLCAKIHNLISDDVQEIKTHLSDLEEAFEKLCHKKRAFAESCDAVDFSQQTTLVTGTPLQPPLKQLLQFAEDSITFGAQICAQIDTTLNVLAFKGISSALPSENLKISVIWQRRIREIISYTSFCSENQI